MFTTKRLHFAFYVKACQEARILLGLTPRVKDQDVYEIVIGAEDNTQSEIRRSIDGSAVDHAETRNILDCNEKR